MRYKFKLNSYIYEIADMIAQTELGLVADHRLYTCISILNVLYLA